MKVKNIIFPAFTLILFILLNSCDFRENKNGPNEYNPYIMGWFYGNNKFPLTNLEVTIDNKTKYTDQSGRFSFDHIPENFDILVEDSAKKIHMIYNNVARYDGYYFHLPVEAGTQSDQLVIAVQCPNLPSSTKGKLYFSANEFGPSIQTYQELDSSSFIVFNAPKNTQISGSVRLITYTTDNNGNIVTYDKYASSGVYPVPGVTSIVTFDASFFSPLNTIQVNCILNSPLSYTSISTDLVFNFGWHRNIFYNNINQSVRNFTTNNFNIFLPLFSTDFIGQPSLFIKTESQEGITKEMKLVTEGNAIVYNLASLPFVMSPENNAINVDSSTVFSFQKQPASDVLIFTLMDLTNNINYSYFTKENNITLKTLSPMITLEPNKTYGYQIEQVGVTAKNVSDYLRETSNVQSYSGKSPVRYFTTKP